MKRTILVMMIALGVLAALIVGAMAAQRRGELVEEIDRLKAEAERLERAGHLEKAERVWHEAEELLERLESREADDEEREGEEEEEEGELAELERRFDHLREAAEHLDLAGMDEWADEVRQAAEETERDLDEMIERREAEEREEEEYEEEEEEEEEEEHVVAEAMEMLGEILDVVHDLRAEIRELHERVELIQDRLE